MSQNDYQMMSDAEKLSYWRNLIAHKVRAQAEVSDDSYAFVTRVFIAHCLKTDPKFSAYAAKLSDEFPELFVRIAKSKDTRSMTLSGCVTRVLVGLCALIFLAAMLGMSIGNPQFFVVVLVFTSLLLSFIYGGAVWYHSKCSQYYEALAHDFNLQVVRRTGKLPGIYVIGLSGNWHGRKIEIESVDRYVHQTRYVASLNRLDTGGYQTFVHLKVSDCENEKRDHESIFKSLANEKMPGKFSSLDNQLVYAEPGGRINSESMYQRFSLLIKNLSENF